MRLEAIASKKDLCCVLSCKAEITIACGLISLISSREGGSTLSIIGQENTLEVSLETSVRLSKILLSHKNPLISESGIIDSSNIKYIIEKTNISNFLIGESLLKSENIGLTLGKLSKITL